MLHVGGLIAYVMMMPLLCSMIRPFLIFDFVLLVISDDVYLSRPDVSDDVVYRDRMITTYENVSSWWRSL